MNAEDDAFVKDLAASLDELSRSAPPGPDAARMRTALRGRRNRRLGTASMVVLGIAIACVAAFMRYQPGRPPQWQAEQEIVEIPRPPAHSSRDHFEPSPLPMPTVSFVGVSLPGAGAAGRLDADPPAMSMPTVAASNVTSVSMRMSMPTMSMPTF
jgi:hypothetical protein